MIAVSERLAFKIIEQDLLASGDQQGLDNLAAFKNEQISNPQAFAARFGQLVLDENETIHHLEGLVSQNSEATFWSFRG